jgi:hypothetical protein
MLVEVVQEQVNLTHLDKVVKVVVEEEDLLLVHLDQVLHKVALELPIEVAVEVVDLTNVLDLVVLVVKV